jgi:predicted RNase H-like HicB family nuclease
MKAKRKFTVVIEQDEDGYYVGGWRTLGVWFFKGAGLDSTSRTILWDL